MEAIKPPQIHCGVARFVLSSAGESGDLHSICPFRNGLLLSVVDGIGHGEEAAHAARAAVSSLQAASEEHVILLVQRCHQEIRSTRGVVLSLASIDFARGMMTWLGIGNVQGVLLRCFASSGPVQEMLLLRGGVVGAQLPPLQATVLPISRGDTLVFATDGVRPSFVDTLSALESPQRAADRIPREYRTGNDDALVLVVRLAGGVP